MLCEYLSNYAFISTVIQSLRDQIDEIEIDLNSNIELQEQMQSKIECLSNTEKANNRTIQELLDQRIQFQATVDAQKKTIDEMSQIVKLLLGKPEYVST
jgi:MoaA/NifB/PqqE/SkfB family radical SAM enzyme